MASIMSNSSKNSAFGKLDLRDEWPKNELEYRGIAGIYSRYEVVRTNELI